MGIDLHVAGDEQSCRDTANRLQTVAEGITRGGGSFHTARSESESLWRGAAGDAFRDRLHAVGQHTDEVASHTHTAGQVIHGFADDLATVTSRMNQARGIATGAGLTMDGDTIQDPVKPHPIEPLGPASPLTPASATPDHQELEILNSAAQQTYQKQQQAYQQAQQTVNEARTIEQNAHHTLEQRMNAWQTMLDDVGKSKYWLLGGNAVGLVGTAISQADKWGKIAAARNTQLDMFKRIAAESDYPPSKSAAARAEDVFEPSATKAQAALKGNFKLGGRLAGTKAGNILSSSLSDIPKVGSKILSIAEKLPIVGDGLALAQTAFDSRDAKNAGDVAKAASADLGGYAAGSLAAGETLAAAASFGLAGGPVTLAAVGVGAGVASGVGEVVKHWPEISHWAGHTASTIGHGLGDAAQSVGHFFESVF